MVPLALVGGYYSKKVLESLFATFTAFSANKSDDFSVSEAIIKMLELNKWHIGGMGAVLTLLLASSRGDRGKQGQLSGSIKEKKSAGSVDATFWKHIKELIKVVIPSYTGKEARYISLLLVIIALRT